MLEFPRLCWQAARPQSARAFRPSHPHSKTLSILQLLDLSAFTGVLPRRRRKRRISPRAQYDLRLSSNSQAAGNDASGMHCQRPAPALQPRPAEASASSSGRRFRGRTGKLTPPYRSESPANQHAGIWRSDSHRRANWRHTIAPRYFRRAGIKVSATPRHPTSQK